MSFSSDFDSDDFYSGVRMDHLSCIRNAHLIPESSSLHSLDLLPVENGKSPGFMAVTLKTIDSRHLYNSSIIDSPDSGNNIPIWSLEVRVVHGNDEVHSIVRKSASRCQVSRTTIQETITSGVWSLTLKSVLELDEECLTKFCCDVLGSLGRGGWEVSTSGRTTTTPGFEYVTWIMKSSSSSVPSNMEVIGIVMSEDNGTVSVVPSCPQINNVVKKSIDTFEITNRNRDEMGVEERVREIEKKEMTTHDQSARRVANYLQKDDPECSSHFKVDALKKKSDPGKEERIVCSSIILEIVHLLFCRQWKFISSARIPIKDVRHKSVFDFDVVFFCRDGRILPSLGQQKFAMVELEGPNFLRFYNMPEETVSSLIPILESDSCWPDGLLSKDPVVRFNCCKEFRLNGTPWTHKRRHGTRTDQGEVEDKIVARSTVAANYLVTQMLLTLSKNGFNLFSAIQLGPSGAGKKTHLIFKHSSVEYEAAMCLHLSGQNKVVVIGGGEEELGAVRQALISRWPYPVSIDRALNINNGSIWLFKVKRYPWAISYGNKYIDRTVEWTRSFLRNRHHIPSPQNNDSESGKSVLVFLIKELMAQGWRIQTSSDISSSSYNVRNSHARLSDPHSLFFMK